MKNELLTKDSQTARLYRLLLKRAGKWVSTVTILRVVYGSEHLGIARIGARIADLKNLGYEIESTPYDIRGKAVIWAYMLLDRRACPVEKRK